MFMKEEPITFDDQISFEAVASILRASTYKKQIEGNPAAMFSWKTLKNIFPALTFIENQFSYVNPFNKKTVSISSLVGKSFFKTVEQRTSQDFRLVQANVNLLLNKKKYLEELMSNEYIQRYVDRLNIAIEKQKKQRKHGHDAFCNASDAISGRYNITPSHDIVITNDPVQIFMKSTGRSWEKESCERVGGQYESGIFSDIEWCNLVAFLYKKQETENPIGRVMIRTCNTDKEEPSFGIEPIWYTNVGKITKESNKKINGISVKSLEEKLIAIIHDKGYSMDYETCETPYTYEGYSDNAHAGNTSILYGQGKITVDDILSQAILTLGSRCPYCTTLNQWEIEFRAEHVTTESLEQVFRNTPRENIFYAYSIANTWADYEGDGIYKIHGGSFPRKKICPTCHAEMILYENDDESIEKYKQIVGKGFTKMHKGYVFMDYGYKERSKLLASKNIMQMFFLNSMSTIKSFRMKNFQDFVEFLLIHEAEKNIRYQKARSASPGDQKYKRPGITIDYRYNDGDDMMEVDDDEVIVYIRNDLIDYDKIADEFLEIPENVSNACRKHQKM